MSYSVGFMFDNGNKDDYLKKIDDADHVIISIDLLMIR